MTTIEERAEAIYKGNTIEEDAYKRGAAEQKVIDAERFQNKIIQLFKETDGAEINGSWWDMDELIDFLLG